MARLFISHSSRNDDWAIAIADWLVREGWSGAHDIFLDLDPQRGLAAGQRWAHELEAAATRCEAVLFLVSEAWLASKWCHDEYRLADKYGKKLFALLVDDIALERLPGGLAAQWQIVRLQGTPAERFLTVHPHTGAQSPVHIAERALASLKRGLDKAGIGAETFDLQRDAAGPLGWRAVYRGLEALEPEDAAVFFGRNADIVRGIDALRMLAARTPPRLMVVLGASGAGKSSFLRAGLWPRLRRDDSQWLPLRAIRAGRGGAIEGGEGLLAALEEVHQRFGLKTSRAALRTSLATPDAFVALLGTLRAAAARRALLTAPPAPLPILCLDQGEELFAADAGPESARLLALARAAIEADAALLLVTIRSDSYGLMQSAPVLAGIDQQPLSLGPVPQGEIARIIREPAELLRRAAGPDAPLFDPEVVARLQEEIAGEADALPLLAFVLQRLMREHAGVGIIGLAELEATGGVAAAIESEAEKALDDAGFGADRGARREALQRLFIPRLARIDRTTKTTQRRVSPQGELPADLLPLAKALTQRRLLVTKLVMSEGSTSAATLEVAHEALLRRWPTLVDLLVEDRDALLLLDGLVSAAIDWKRAEETFKPDFLVHRGTRLSEAKELMRRGADWGREITRASNYLLACDEKERREQEAAAVANMTLEHQLASLLAELSRLAEQSAYTDRAIRFAVYGAKIDERLPQHISRVSQAKAQLTSLMLASRCSLVLHDKFGYCSAEFIDGGKEILLVSNCNAVSLVDAFNGNKKFSIQGQGHNRLRAALSADKSKLLTLAYDGLFEDDDELICVWDIASERCVGSLRGQRGKVNGVWVSNDWSLALVRKDMTAALWDIKENSLKGILRAAEQDVFYAAFSVDGRYILLGFDNNKMGVWDSWDLTNPILIVDQVEYIMDVDFDVTNHLMLVASDENSGADLWDLVSMKNIATFVEPDSEYPIHFARFCRNGKYIITCAGDTARVWDKARKVSLHTICGHKKTVSGAFFSENSSTVITVSEDKTAKTWDTFNGTELLTLVGHNDQINAASFNTSGESAITTSFDGTVRLWNTTQNHFGSPLQQQKSIMAALGQEARRVVAVLANSKDALLWNPYKQNEFFTLVAHTAAISDLSIDATSGQILTTSDDKTARIWDSATGMLVRTFRHHKDKVVFGEWSNSGELVATASDDGIAIVWEAETGRRVLEISNPRGEKFTFAVFANANDQVAFVSGEDVVVYSLVNGEKICECFHEEKISCCAFSANGSSIVTTSWDRSAKIWNITSGKLNAACLGHDFFVESARFDVTGNRIVTAGGTDETARIWDTSSGQEILCLRGHKDYVDKAIFSPDGRHVISTSTDKTVRVWDTGSGREIAVLPMPDFLVTEPRFTSDGRYLLLVFADGSLKIYPFEAAMVPSENLINIACARQLQGISTMTRDEMRLAGYADSEPLIDVCKDVH